MNGLYFQWHITDVCNFRCRHCYQDKFDNSSELDIKGLRIVSDRIIHAADEQGAGAVINITGGEPFLKNELFELLDYLDSHKEIARLAVITNASLINPRLIRELKRIKKIDQVKISLEAGSASANDVIRADSSFTKAIEAIRLLKESGLSVIVMFTAMKSNLKEMKSLYELCQGLGVDGLIAERFFPMGEGANISSELLDRQDWFSLVNSLCKLTGEELIAEDMLDWRGFWVRFLKEKAELWGASCNVGEDSFCIMPNADVYPCRRFKLKLGNLLEKALPEIINSSLLADIISGRRKGRCAECDVLDCRGCPALAYLITGDYLSEDSQCWYGA